MHVIETVIPIGWLVFWIYWLAMAFTAKENKGGGRLTQFPGTRATVVVLVLLVFRLRVFHTSWATANTSVLLGGIGLAVFVLGLALAVWARVYLGRNWGMPMSERAEPELVTSGPYRAIRHPIYTGIIVAFVGTALAIGVYWFIAAAIIGAYFSYSATVEERNMTRLFPETYPPYKRATKMLVPFIL